MKSDKDGLLGIGVLIKGKHKKNEAVWAHGDAASERWGCGKVED